MLSLSPIAKLAGSGDDVGRLRTFWDFMAEQLNFIRVRGAREHNLKDVSVDIPRGSWSS